MREAPCQVPSNVPAGAHRRSTGSPISDCPWTTSMYTTSGLVANRQGDRLTEALGEILHRGAADRVEVVLRQIAGTKREGTQTERIGIPLPLDEPLAARNTSRCRSNVALFCLVIAASSAKVRRRRLPVKASSTSSARRSVAVPRLKDSGFTIGLHRNRRCRHESYRAALMISRGTRSLVAARARLLASAPTEMRNAVSQ